ncbi:hypothetical protein [Vibrio bivalvicida]|uniref:Uncharacterized protein n=1 Tax=Vibrio bivalvicida TaxID=1276888 RepID=A0A177Y0Q8_9VIBR|nr:hypothetical protein [Vibrio bivalvicida]OAJ94453.1 hypothetical protein APB76_09745 [Vibrio bivalvicida]
MYLKKLEDIDVSFSDYEVGLDRFVRSVWALQMYRHHVFREELSNQFILDINRINESLGISVKTIDLNEHKESFSLSENLNKSIEENQYPVWVWFYGVEALKEQDFSGWLRSRLTARSIENLRVVFVAESSQDYQDVFCDSSAPFYKSTMLLQTQMFT